MADICENSSEANLIDVAPESPQISNNTGNSSVLMEVYVLISLFQEDILYIERFEWQFNVKFMQ